MVEEPLQVSRKPEPPLTWVARLRRLPLRTKLALTAVVAVVALAGGSTHLSFRYWRGESLAAAEQQALLVARSTRVALESDLAFGHTAEVHRTLTRLIESGPVTAARIYAQDGTVVASAELSEEGRRTAGIWIPAASELPRPGVARRTLQGDAVRAFLPLAIPEAAVLEIEFSVASVKAAMDRGARLGIALMVGSILALVLVLVTMIEREVVKPLRRVDDLLAESGAASGEEADDELGRLESSVSRLIRMERESERRAAARDRELAEREGLAEVGQLAAEMAHEFKRPLASIGTAIGLLEQEYVLDEAGQQLMGAVHGQLERLSETMRDLFSLARPVVLDRERLDVVELLDDALVELAGYPGAADVKITRAYDGSTPPGFGDARRLQQAFLNLMVNAVEAMPEGGELAVRTRPMGDDWLEVRIQDTGGGIPEGEVERALKPFYSTKPLGTGLGLPLVARIVAAHGGRLEFDSKPGVGTTVRVVLPAWSIPEPETEPPEWRASGFSSSMTTNSSERS